MKAWASDRSPQTAKTAHPVGFNQSEKLVRATAKVEFSDMRDKIMKVFGDPGVLNETNMVPDVKEEVMYGQSYPQGNQRENHTVMVRR